MTNNTDDMRRYYLGCLGLLTALFVGTLIITGIIGELRQPLWTAWEYVWVWWCNGPSHYFVRPL